MNDFTITELSKRHTFIIENILTMTKKEIQSEVNQVALSLKSNFGEEFMSDILATLQISLHSFTKDLTELIKRGDKKQVQNKAHKMAGTFVTLGFEKFAEPYKKLERLAQKNVDLESIHLSALIENNCSTLYKAMQLHIDK